MKNSSNYIKVDANGNITVSGMNASGVSYDLKTATFTFPKMHFSGETIYIGSGATVKFPEGVEGAGFFEGSIELLGLTQTRKLDFNNPGPCVVVNKNNFEINSLGESDTPDIF